MKEKFCKGCLLTLDIGHFSRSKNVKDGYENKCRKCRMEQRKKRNNLICEECGNVFASAKTNAKFCSRKCMGNSKKKSITLQCEQCYKEYQKIPSLKEVSRFCSMKCRNEYDKQTMLGENNHNYKRVSTKCDGCDEIIEVIPFDYKRLKHNFCSFECYKNNIGQYKTGANNYNYRHDLTEKERIMGRNYTEYPLWRASVYERDNYTCRVCGDKTSGNLNAHHLDGYNWCVEKRVDVDNGVTLCNQCHTHFHSEYGYGDNTKQQFIKFYNTYNKPIMSQA